MGKKEEGNVYAMGCLLCGRRSFWHTSPGAPHVVDDVDDSSDFLDLDPPHHLGSVAP